MSKHTPGPWKAEMHPLGGSPRWYIEFGPMKATICAMNNSCLLYSNAESDARLIAAAPDLLAALETALDHAQEHQTGCLWCGEDEDYVEENGESSAEHKAACWYYCAQATIAKARGGKP